MENEFKIENPEEFPILGGRLLKADGVKGFRGKYAFPILGGRLLKKSSFFVSEDLGRFPILGGRLLKKRSYFRPTLYTFVSNPWREAIEDEIRVGNELLRLVSNPWREAIEVFIGNINKISILCFQSLEGGY